MEILEEDFSEEFLSRFGDKEKQYILDFCNTFQKTFPDVLDKQELLNKINRLKSFKVWDGNSEVGGHSLGNGETGFTSYNDMSIIYRDRLEARDERNTIYHELFHLISYKKFELGLFEDVLIEYEDELYSEDKALEEIMNEFYAIKMLENEGRFRDDIVETSSFNKLNRDRIIAPQKGNGYIYSEPIAEIYDKTFGIDMLKAKLFDRKPFMDKFNKDFGALNIETIEGRNIPVFSKIGIQIGEDKYKAGETALRIWKQKYIEKHSEDKFDLYEYLKESFDIQKSLYRLETFSNGYRGNINVETLSKYSDIFREFDEELIIKHYRPDLVGEQTETDKIIEKKQIRAVIDSLRDNIEGLTKEEIGEVSYGTIPEYTHSNMHCLIIKAGKKEFMTFADEDEYRGSSEFSKLPESITQEIFGDNRNVEYAEVPTHRDKWSIIKDENRYMDPNQNPLELVEEKRLDGTPITVKEEKDIPDSSSLEEVSDDDDSKGTQKITKPIGPQKTKTSSQAFRDSVSNAINKSSNDEITTDERKIHSQAFRDAISKKRTSEKTGMSDVKKSQDDISLRKERADLIRQKMFGQLDEDRKRRLEKINRLLNIKNTNLQQFEANKKRQGQSR